MDTPAQPYPRNYLIALFTCAVAAALALAALSGQFLRYRWCHANAFAGASHADWQTAFLGDSITQLFQYPATNFGFIGATSADLRGILNGGTLRCRCYRRIVVLAGTNDVLKDIPEPQTIANVDAILAEAQRNNLTVFVGTVPPVFGKYAARNKDIDALNRDIAKVASRRGARLLDYNSAIQGHPEWSWDGVHITKEGYAAILHVLQTAKAV